MDKETGSPLKHKITYYEYYHAAPNQAAVVQIYDFRGYNPLGDDSAEYIHGNGFSLSVGVGATHVAIGKLSSLEGVADLQIRFGGIVKIIIDERRLGSWRMHNKLVRHVLGGLVRRHGLTQIRYLLGSPEQLFQLSKTLEFDLIALDHWDC